MIPVPSSIPFDLEVRISLVIRERERVSEIFYIRKILVNEKEFFIGFLLDHLKQVSEPEPQEFRKHDRQNS